MNLELVLEVTLLGGFGVRLGDRTVPQSAWRLRKAQTLVKLLALAPGHRLVGEQIMDILWPDLDPEAAANNLHQALYQARRALATIDPSLRDALGRDAQMLALAGPTSIRVDANEFERAASTALRSDDPALYDRALALYGGDLLPDDRYEDWCAARRETLRDTYLNLLVSVAALHEARGDLARAIDACRRAIAADPLHEDAHVALMRLYALAGQRHQALRQYEALRDVLKRELDVDPARESQELVSAIGAGRYPPRQDASRASPVPRASAGNLPSTLTRLIGRCRELDELRALLRDARLLTLVGPPGVGKTRLALALAESVAPAYADGVWFVDLAPLNDERHVLGTIAATLHVQEVAGQPLLNTLKASLQSRSLLLLLDNCEHLVEQCSHIVSALLQACPRLRVLATSREPLHVPGAIAWPVPPLAVPVDAGIEESAAAELFVDRVRWRRAKFEPDIRSAAAIATICRRLEGNPLALELAAARSGVLSIVDIAARLNDSLALLATASSAVASRHRSLRTALDWSFRLLSDAEQTLFCRLAVFAGGWTLEAVEAMIDEPGTALDLLSRLVDASLVEADVRHGVRYRFTEPVRQYAEEIATERKELAESRQRHSEYFLDFAERAEPELRGPDQAYWLDSLDSERDNLRVALQWLIETGNREWALRMGAALWRFWFSRGYLSEGRRWLQRLIEQSDRHCVPAAYARVVHGAGALAYYQSDIEQAVAHYEQALALYRDIGDPRGVAAMLGNLGLATKERGDVDRAASLYQESREIYEALGHDQGVASALNNLGILYGDRGDYERAESLHHQSLALKRKLGDLHGVATSLNNLGSIAVDRQDFPRAKRLLEEALTLSRELGHKRSMAVALVNLGHVARSEGDIPRAMWLYGQTLELSAALGNALFAMESLEGIAPLYAEEGRIERAVQLLAISTRLRAELGVPLALHLRTSHERVLTQARASLDDAAFGAARAAGEVSALDAIVHDILAEIAAVPTPDSQVT